mmetsp:Transcript_2590/g.7306  ORF Transcript_2590/g.7306 Transcript_2590/m.7306 type:complete len:617 (-) Transcript_2590:127-1977(-)
MAAASSAKDVLDGDGMTYRAGNGDRMSVNLKAFMPQRLNAEISKRYDIDAREIGSGGYGKVFVAKDRQMRDRMVAIKKVVIFDDEKKAAFLKEVDIMRDLDHPNICKLLETYEQGRFMFFVMEYCEGREVFDRIMETGSIDEKTTADIVKQAASALKYSHNRGIAHRDLKPENICFCSKDPANNTIKVIDWGLGFYFGQARMNSAVGSLTYAAPEVLEAKEGDGYNAACDLWSLGVVTYVMLCGKPPFWGNYSEQLRKMKKEQYPMTDATWQAISPEAKDLIKGLLKNNPAQRMTLDGVLKHTWLSSAKSTMDAAITQTVLSNMKQFSNTSQFFSLCVASVARQLDHRSLRDVHKVFCEMDTNGDGVLELNEVKNGFEKIFGKDSKESREVEEMFKRLDLDGSGTIDYTEFCAAGIGERMSTEENVLWAAFKTFDIHDDDGKISKDEIKQVLMSADVNKVWAPEVCENICKEIFSRFDGDGDETLDFQEWLKLMREIAHQSRDSDKAAVWDSEEQVLLKELDTTVTENMATIERFDKAYTLLVELDRKGPPACRTPTSNDRSPYTSASASGQRLNAGRSPSGALATLQSMRNATPACFMCETTSQEAPAPSNCSLM